MPSSASKKYNSYSSYSKPLLLLYDMGVVRFSTRFLWGCSKENILKLYNNYISTKHLEIGVGTGYFLDKCQFPSEMPEIYLLDMNPNPLQVTSHRLRRYYPKIHQADILKPITLDLPKFDSIAINYVLHCLPGTMQNKTDAFKNIAPFLNEGGVIFGTTVLKQDKNTSYLAKKVMHFYNKKGIFSNHEDTLESLENILAANFKSYTLKKIGGTALFTGYI